jgi:hypothetical protein
MRRSTIVKISRNLLIIAAAVVIFLILALFLSRSADGKGPENLDAFAQCLGDSGAKMYGASWCSHCNDQKDMFGDSWEHVDYVECSGPLGGQAAECVQAGIEGYPTWEFPDGGKKAGTLTFEQLSQFSGCPLEA